MSSSFKETMLERSKSYKNQTLILPESTDARILLASEILLQEKICEKIIFIGNEEVIVSKAKELEKSLHDKIEIIDPLQYKNFESFVQSYYDLRKHKGMTLEQANQALQQPIIFGTMMIKKGLASAMVAGAIHATADVLRPAIQIIGTKKETKLVSACFVIESSNVNLGYQGQCIFADCATVPKPSSENLVDITLASAQSCRDFLNTEPIISLLSFSTLGSAEHEEVTRVRNAVEILKTKHPTLIVDGELQLDAALSPSVANLKAPNSPTAGKSNVLIFPDLASGNIAYKTTQQFGNTNAYGPFIQGLAAPITDLSRGCTVNEIVLSCATTLCQSGNKQSK